MAHRIPSRFRAFLRGELAQWRAEGVVDAATAEALTRRYGLDEAEGPGLALGALYVLAAGLVGAGVISLVAWHWEQMPAAVRLALLGTVLVAAHASGYWMWKVTARQPRLGHAVSLLGTLLFGASIGLVAQIFHLSGAWYRFFGGWALGALAAGLALPSAPALGFAFILALYVWGPGYMSDRPELSELIAWGVGLSALALAVRSRSRVLFLLAYAGAAVLVAWSIRVVGGTGYDELFLALLFWIAAAACAVAALRPRGEPHRFAGVAGALGRIAFYVLAYAFSFGGGMFHLGGVGWFAARGWLTCALPVAVAALVLLVRGLRSGAPWATRAVAAAVTVFAAVFSVIVQGRSHSLGVAVLSNAGVLAVAGLRMAQGLRERQRGPFWEGLVLAALVATSRFFQIEEMLLLKGAGFILCGVGVIAAGMAFERRVRAGRSEVGHA